MIISNKNMIACFLLFIFITLFIENSCKRHLNNFIKNYDRVNYDKDKVNNGHLRVQRSIDKYIYLKFKSLGKDFKLKLQPSDNTYFNTAEIEIESRMISTSIHNNFHRNFYKGYLIDEPNDSHVNGILLDGLFYGTITSKKHGQFYIESSRKYKNNFNYNISLNKSNLIIYHANDIDLGFFKNNTNESSVHCGSTNKNVYEWLQSEQQIAFEERIRHEGFNPFNYVDFHDLEDEKNKYSREKNEKQTNFENVDLKNNKSIHKRNADSDDQIHFVKNAIKLNFPDKRTVCNLYLKVDSYLYNEIYKNEGNQHESTTLTYLLFFMNKHVEFLNSVFNNLPFYNTNKNEYYIGVQFAIHRTKIITSSQCDKQNDTEWAKLNEEEKKLCEPYLDVSTFLNYVSLDNYSDYCLAYTFTARDFSDGTLGLAWVAKLTGSAGGVCEKRQMIQGVQKSLNTGILTVVNYQSRVPELVSQLTLAHEVAHNFGSEHDPKSGSCAPGNLYGGNFIMYRSATTGREKNNRNFSECSRSQMGPVLHALVNNQPKFCFTKYNGSLCGNGIVEIGEDCDCGYKGECNDECCYDASEIDSSKRCKLKPKAKCSPTQGPCCTKHCEFELASTICLQASECLLDVTCTGKNSFCPRSSKEFFKTNYTSCNSGTQVCLNGMCSGSICEKYNMSQCYLEGDLKDKNLNKSVLCHLACIGEKTNHLCVDSFDIPEIKSHNGEKSGLILKPGSPCMGTLGYCDIFSKCRSVDAEGPLLRLKNLLLNSDTLTTVQIWIRNYWYGFVIVLIGLLVFMTMFIKICSVHTPSSNPNNPVKAIPIFQYGETLKRHMKRNHQNLQPTVDQIELQSLRNKRT